MVFVTCVICFFCGVRYSREPHPLPVAEQLREALAVKVAGLSLKDGTYAVYTVTPSYVHYNDDKRTVTGIQFMDVMCDVSLPTVKLEISKGQLEKVEVDENVVTTIEKTQAVSCLNQYLSSITPDLYNSAKVLAKTEEENSQERATAKKSWGY